MCHKRFGSVLLEEKVQHQIDCCVQGENFCVGRIHWALGVKSLRRNLTVIFEIDLYGTLDCVNVAEVECGVIWTKHGTYTMLTPNTLYHTNYSSDDEALDFGRLLVK